jgi:hypothetical protein
MHSEIELCKCALNFGIDDACFLVEAGGNFFEISCEVAIVVDGINERFANNDFTGRKVLHFQLPEQVFPQGLP